MRSLVLLASCLTIVACRHARCTDDIVVRAPSPDGALDAVVYDRVCGEGTASSRQVGIVPAGEVPAPMGQVLVLSRTVPVTILWIRERGLSVAYPSNVATRMRRSEVRDVHIVFEPLSMPGTP